MANVNTGIVYQASTVLNTAIKQATGQNVLATNNNGEFVSVAQSVLAGPHLDPILGQLSQMWGKTIFSSRPYTAKLRGLEMDDTRWGNITRKIKQRTSDLEDDKRFTGPNAVGGSGSVDMYDVKKPNVIEACFYGQSVYENHVTIYKDNLDVAFKDASEFMRFNSDVMVNRSNKLELAYETAKRGTLANAIATCINAPSNGRVFKALTAYNNATGLTLTAQDIWKPANLEAFARWLYAEISAQVNMMSEYGVQYQIGPSDLYQHTSADRLRAFINTDMLEKMKACVLAPVYHDDKYFDLSKAEAVNFWQAPDKPLHINGKFSTSTWNNSTNKYSKSDVTVNTESVGSGADAESQPVIGFLMDMDAAGVAKVNAWNQLTPFNAAGGYWNDWDHANIKTRLDVSEKMMAIVLA